MSSLLKALPRLAASAALLVTALTSACSSTPEAEPAKVLHLFNPFRLQGLRPYVHSEAVGNWTDLGQMTDEGCEWFRYDFSGPPGGFRFYGGGWDGPRWGADGMHTEPLAGPNLEPTFNFDGAWASSDHLYLVTYPEPEINATEPPTDVKPFECDPSLLPTAVNPYLQGQLPTRARPSHLQALFDIWYANFYEESGNLARIRFDNPAQTVSEGIGYGMLIFVFMDSSAGEYKRQFDYLFNYYNTFANANGLMNWVIDGFASVAQPNAASDADLDVAVALLAAAARWGDPAYQTAALAQIARIRQFEFNADGFLMPGDAWDTAKNPSYFSFVAFELFRRVDVGYEAFWADVITRHYNLILTGRNPTTGLIPNWTNEAGVATDPQNGYPHDWSAYGYDAVRVPWRAAWAWAWFGQQPEHQPAYQIASAICGWAAAATGTNAQNLRAEYRIDGTPIGQNLTAGPGIVGMYGAACMVEPTHQPMLDATYDWMNSQFAAYDVVYYQSSLQVLAALLLTGNMPYLWAY